MHHIGNTPAQHIKEIGGKSKSWGIPNVECITLTLKELSAVSLDVLLCRLLSNVFL